MKTISRCILKVLSVGDIVTRSMQKLLRTAHARWGTGFTLVELLTVIAIIGILSSIVMASLLTARQKGRDARRIADIKQIQLALEQYYNEYLKYPTSLSSLSPNYISVLPSDPLGSSYANGGVYYYVAANASGTTNCVNISTPAIYYHLAAVQEVQGTLGVGNYGSNPGRYYSFQTICGGTVSGDFNGASIGCTIGSGAPTSPGQNAPAGTATTCYDAVSQ